VPGRQLVRARDAPLKDDLVRGAVAGERERAGRDGAFAAQAQALLTCGIIRAVLALGARTLDLLTMTDDPHRLQRFIDAQGEADTYERALSELRAGHKTSHWVWFVFPQIAGLGHSPNAMAYAISSLAEASAYLAHPLLGPRLLECTRALMDIRGATAGEILGEIDAMKLRSSMTLFAHAAPREPLFRQILDRYFDGAADDATEQRLSPATLVQLSDLHLRVDEDRAGPAGRLERAVRQVAALQPRASAVLLSGDLADAPASAAYEQAHELLAPLGIPLHAIPGNHDDRDLLRARFGPGPAPAGARVHLAVSCGALRLVGCDSTRPGSDGGALGGAELRWLDETLGQQPQTPTLLALHHPPVLTGVRCMDAIALAAEDRIALEDLLGGHPQVQAITCGHVHTTMTTCFAGRPLLICPSTNSALRLDLRARDDLPFASSHEPLGFAVHALVDGRLVSHVQPLAQVAEA
jgi:uncharacterized protein (DUF1810 family)